MRWLVPQFRPRIPCYPGRRGRAAQRRCRAERRLLRLGGSPDSVYFHQQSVPGWTLEYDESDPPRRRQRLRAIRWPKSRWPCRARQTTTERGPGSPRHKPWTDGGGKPAHFDWVDLEASLQWRAFQRMIGVLAARGNDVLVILGPFNEHMVAKDRLWAFHKLAQRRRRLAGRQSSPHVTPDALPSEPLRRRQPSADRGLCAAGQADLPRPGFSEVARRPIGATTLRLIPLRPAWPACGLANAAEAIGFGAEADIDERGWGTLSGRRPADVLAGGPTAAPQDPFAAAGRAVRIATRAGWVVMLAVKIVAPLGHIPVHIVQTPGIRDFLLDGVRGLAGIPLEPSLPAQLTRIVAERPAQWSCLHGRHIPIRPRSEGGSRRQ